MTCIILAAGMGRRLGLDLPKCLIEIGGKSILQRQLAAFRAAGITDVVVVVGYQEQEIRKHLADHPGKFTYVVNPRYLDTNTIYSLYLARDHFGDGFFYANADVVFDARLVHRLLPVDPATLMAVKPGRFGQEEVKVVVEPSPSPGQAPVRISRIGKGLDPARSFGEFVGVARFGKNLVGPLTEALNRCVEAEGITDDHFERAVDLVCLAGERVEGVDIHDLPCGEIDFPEDLEHAHRELAPSLES